MLELSLREALQLGHEYIGTEHILLGLIREGEGIAARVLQHLGGEQSLVRRAVLELVGADPESETGTPSFGLPPDLVDEAMALLDVPQPQRLHTTLLLASIVKRFGVDFMDLVRFIRDQRARAQGSETDTR